MFLNRGATTAPLSMRTNVDHIRVLQEHVIIVSADTLPVPRVPADQRVTVDDLGRSDDEIFLVSIRYGYMEQARCALRAAVGRPGTNRSPIDLGHASHILSKVDFIAGSEPTMAAWRKRLFIAISHMTADAAGYFGLPLDRTVIIGARIEV